MLKIVRNGISSHYNAKLFSFCIAQSIDFVVHIFHIFFRIIGNKHCAETFLTIEGFQYWIFFIQFLTLRVKEYFVEMCH